MALEFVKLIKGDNVVSQVGSFGFFKLGVESSGGGSDDSVIYGVRIDLNNSDPVSSVEYTDDAIGFDNSYMDFTNKKFEYGSWADKFPFNQVKPCIVSGGKVTTYLNPNNYFEDVDGNAVTITGNVDVMIEIPKIYYYMHNDDNYQYLQISNTKVNDNYCCLAHTFNGVENDKVYVSAYHINESGYSRSEYSAGGTSYRTWSGNLQSQSPNSWKNSDQNNSNLTKKKFTIITYHMTNLLKLLFVLQFKTLNCINALGKGYAIYTQSGDPYHQLLGTMNDKGMYWGSKTTSTSSNTSTIVGTKFMGMENAWGNYNSVVYGIKPNSSGFDIVDVTQPTTKPTWITLLSDYTLATGYLSKIYGTNELGFIPKETSGSSSTYYCVSTSASMTSEYSVMFSDYGGSKGMLLLSQLKNNTEYSQATGCRSMYYPQSY